MNVTNKVSFLARYLVNSVKQQIGIMKKLGYIGLLAALTFLFSIESKAQYYYTSYGYAHDWHLPKYVHATVYDHYHGFEIAHVSRFARHGHGHYNVLLHRNGWFIELRLDHRGRIYKTIKHRYSYPLRTHNCTMHCGYHRVYYSNYYNRYPHQQYSHVQYQMVYAKKHHNHQPGGYYTNVYVEPPGRKQVNSQKRVHDQVEHQNNVRSRNPRVIRVSNQDTNLENTDSDRRIQYASNRTESSDERLAVRNIDRRRGRSQRDR